ncbi:MAG: HAD family hydrolase, partial [Candidatus Zixiibacteriota bacterium]
SRFVGQPLTEQERHLVGTLVRQSTHPLSVALAEQLPSGSESARLTELREEPGFGVSGRVNGTAIRVGSAKWVGTDELSEHGSSRVYVAIDDAVRGYFCFENTYRRGIKELLTQLCRRFTVALLSGDNDSERKNITALFGDNAEARFEQSPRDKLRYVQGALASGRRVMMLGDGLNDAGALKAATVGVAVVEDTNAFAPACDAILSATALHRLPRLLSLSRAGINIIKVSVGLSLLYNAVGLWYAASGALSPVVAAILMPASSVSVVLLTTAAVAVVARRKGLWQPWK